jgi:hypothetical protein
VPARAHAERAAAGAVGLGDRFPRIDNDATGRKIRTLNVFEQRSAARVRIIDQEQRGVEKFGGVVRRDRGRHADGDALRAVGQKIGERRRQHHRLLAGAVIARAEIDRVFVDAVDQQACDLRQPRLGVAHRRRIIAVDVAEIALAVDQRIALGEVLRQPHQRVVDRLVAMRMEIAHHVADHLGRLLEGRAGVEPQQAHAVQNAAVHRLEAVARVRQRAVHDGRQRVSEVALLERLAQTHFFDGSLVGGNQTLAHDG